MKLHYIRNVRRGLPEILQLNLQLNSNLFTFLTFTHCDNILSKLVAKSIIFSPCKIHYISYTIYTVSIGALFNGRCRLSKKSLATAVMFKLH